ncbi:hypothetical protein LCGC14_2560240, partial [marine sediment metagenome]
LHPYYEGAGGIVIYHGDCRELLDELDVGTVAHECLTNPGGLDAILKVIPKDALNAQGHRKGSQWKEWSEAHADYIQMKASEIEPIRRMIASVHRTVPKWLFENVLHYEHTIIWRDESGLMLRARPDMIVSRGEHVILPDFKTTRTTTARTFAADVVKYGYHRQGAWYWDAAVALGMSPCASLIIPVDKTPAHETRIYELSREAVELGRTQNRNALHELAWRLETNTWTAPHHGEILTLDLPEWAYREDSWEV